MDLTPKVMEAKAKINKCDLVKLKSIARRKPFKKKNKKTTYGKEENFVNDMISNVLISKI